MEVQQMKKLFVLVLIFLMSASVLATGVSAAAATHTVVAGDSMWKIAVKYQVGLSEIKAANPQTGAATAKTIT
jgi:LysM repeat protein